MSRDEVGRYRWLAPLVVFFAVVASHVWQLGESPLDGTEGLRAMVAHHTLEQRAWLVPHLYDRIYLRKPPLVTWLFAGFEAALGEAEWVWRLPSVLMTAGMAAFLCVMSRRWFGPPAGWVGGLTVLALVPLWAQNRSAEIDATHTAFTIAAVCALIELGFGQPRRRWLWTLFGGVCVGASLLSKVPSPLIGGALVGSAMATRQWRWLLRPTVWGCVILGAALFAAWALAAWLALPVQEYERATMGVRELGTRLSRFSGGPIVTAITLPFIVLAYAFPVALALPIALLPATQRSCAPTERTIIRAVAGTIIGAMLIGVVALLERPRYGFVVLPMLAPLAGAIAATRARGGYDANARLRLRQLMTACTLIMAGLFVTLLVMTHRGAPGTQPPLWLAAATACVFGWTLWNWIRQRVRPAAIGLAALVILTSVAFSYFKNFDRRDEIDAAFIRRMKETTRDDPVIYTCAAMQDQAQLFYYAGVEARTAAEDPKLLALPRDTWLLLTHREWQRYVKALGDRLRNVAELRNKNSVLHLARYEGR